jgi:hypothetical protein
MQQASLYRTASGWVLTSLSRTSAGVWLANLVVHRVAEACTEAELGSAVLESLDASQEGVPHPDSLPVHHRLLRDKLGVGSYDLFLVRARLLAAHRVGPVVLLTPHRNRGIRLGFEPLSGKVSLQGPSPPEMGEAVRRCAEQCE